MLNDILEDDAMNYIMHLCDISHNSKNYVLYDSIQRDTGLNDHQVAFIVDFYNQRTQSRSDYLKYQAFGLLFRGIDIDNAVRKTV